MFQVPACVAVLWPHAGGLVVSHIQFGVGLPAGAEYQWLLRTCPTWLWLLPYPPIFRSLTYRSHNQISSVRHCVQKRPSQ